VSSPDLSDYIEVADRIKAFKEAHPDGSLCREEWHVEEVAGQTFVVYTALAYRRPDDPRPGVGTAWEPFPGPTKFTKDSELMNAETAAWGRAIASLGFEVRKIASREEVRNRSGNTAAASARPQNGTTKVSEKQIKFMAVRAKQAGLTDANRDLLLRNRFGVERLDEMPRSGVDEWLEAVKQPIPTGESDIPVEAPEQPAQTADDVPWSA
jgi:hypothetical protein